MEDIVRNVLMTDVNPILARHYGSICMTEFSDGVVYVKLDGACGTCPSAQGTIEDVVKTILISKVPQVKNVILDTTVSEDLLNMARKILRQ